MQRIRSTEKGVQLTQELDVVTFGRVEDDRFGTSVFVHAKEAMTNAEDIRFSGGSPDYRTYTIGGNPSGVDTIRDFTLLIGRDVIVEPAEGDFPEESQHFLEYTKDPHTFIGCIAVDREALLDRTSQKEFDRIANMYKSQAIYEKLREISFFSDKLPAFGDDITDVDVRAFAYPLGIDGTMTPLLVAELKHNKLNLHFDNKARGHDKLPMASMSSLIDWVDASLPLVKKKNIFSS